MVTLEILSPEHFGLVAGWLSRRDINRWLSSEWRGQTVDPRLIAVVVRNKRNRLFLIRCEGKACGVAGLSDIDLIDRMASVWYLLGEAELASRGVVSKGVRQLVRYALDELGLESLHAWIMEDNVRSRRVLEKAGFRELGHMRRAACSAGRQVDRVYFDLAREPSIE
jgi:RimJ/RimL family protein N-acetyltransferase